MTETGSHIGFPTSAHVESFRDTDRTDLHHLLEAPHGDNTDELLAAVVEIVRRCYYDEPIQTVELLDYTQESLVREDGSRISLHLVFNDQPLTLDDVAEIDDLADTDEVLLVTLGPLDTSAHFYIYTTERFDYATIDFDQSVAQELL